jgi:hypothetical protein
MKRTEMTAIWGVLLVGAGLLFLLANMGLFERGMDLVMAMLFAAGGLVFLYVFTRNRAQWWPLIPGCALLGLGSLMFLSAIFPLLGDALGGTIFLGALGTGFWAIYLNRREHWWAIIPGGVLWTLAIVAGIDGLFPGTEAGSVFFLGLGATFGLLYLLPTTEGRIRWAIYPAAAMAVMGLFVAVQQARLAEYVWPLALIVAGLVFIARALARRSREQ